MELHHQSRTLDFGHYGPQRGKLSPRLLPSPAWLRLLPGGRAPGGWEIPAGHGGTLTRKIPGVASRSAPTTRIRSYNLIIHKDLDAPKFRRRNGQGAESTSQWPKSRARGPSRSHREDNDPDEDGPETHRDIVGWIGLIAEGRPEGPRGRPPRE